MKKLIELDSPLYLRRLACEVRRALINSVFWDSGKNDAFKIKIIGVSFQGGKRLWVKATDGKYHLADTTNPLGGFYDENGMEICASRVP